MPDKDGNLTVEDKAKATSWLNQRVKNHNCTSCGQNNWAIGDHLLSNNPFMNGMLVVGGATYPTVFLTCMNCGYLRQYMAVPMGLLPAATPPPAADPLPEESSSKDG